MASDNKKRDMHRFWLGMSGVLKWFSLLRKNKNTHYVISSFGIGDAMLACAYLRAYKKAFNIQHITLVGKKSMGEIFELYRGEYDELMLLDTLDIVKLSDAFCFDYAYCKFYKWEFRVTPAVIICHIKNFDMIDLNNGYFYSVNEFTDIYKSLVYTLPKDAETIKPNFSGIPGADEISEIEKSAVKNRSVLLCPYANSIKPVKIAFWEELALSFKSKGYTCFTNCFNDDKPINGTQPVSLKLKETVAFAEFCGNVVALRSGICDLIQYADCKLVIIYPNDCLNKFYRLEGEKIKEFVLTRENYKDEILDITNYVCMKGDL